MHTQRHRRCWRWIRLSWIKPGLWAQPSHSLCLDFLCQVYVEILVSSNYGHYILAASHFVLLADKWGGGGPLTEVMSSYLHYLLNAGPYVGCSCNLVHTDYLERQALEHTWRFAECQGSGIIVVVILISQLSIQLQQLQWFLNDVNYTLNITILWWKTNIFFKFIISQNWPELHQ